ncbi:hypothetical protein GGD67_002262 [Bradyrhizobium sp. IAR9]|uniref:hypothetical protein n=1 Tax=Bradyrhizobium sp. IAR9 TaxID=2663841 RepID=UPI0015CAA3DE|nr:hypothetical protein [Bradyrhizobium sp. IAR9]NYG44814.1 hypothetical protein [Bradyrhizobium sp. IAR9]
MSVQTRAMHIGRSNASRKVVTYRSGHFTGYVPSVRNERMIQYESILERDYIMLLEADRDVASYTEQPAAIEWSDGVDFHTTTFDFCVTLSSGKRYLVEVKPLAKVVKYGLDELYGYARATAKDQGYDDLELWTDRELKAEPRLLNAVLVASATTPFESAEVQLALLTAIREIRRITSRVTVRELRAASKLGDAAYWAIVRMVARGQLIPAHRTAPLDDRAVLMFAGDERGAATLGVAI